MTNVDDCYSIMVKFMAGFKLPAKKKRADILLLLSYCFTIVSTAEKTTPFIGDGSTFP